MQARLPAAVREDLIATLQKCREKKDHCEANRLLAFLRQRGLDSHPVLGNYLVPMLVDCGSLPEACRIFSQLPRPNEHSWTTLISGYIDRGDLRPAFDLYHQMQQAESVQPSRYTYLALLSAYAKFEDAQCCRELHAEVVLRGLETDLYIGSTLVNMYAKQGCLKEARLLFDRLLARDVVLWNALITGYVELGFDKEALSCFRQMQMEGVSADAVTFISNLKACGALASIDTGQELHTEITQKGFDSELFVGNTLVDMYTKCNSFVEARQLFKWLPVRDTSSWNNLIAGYIEQGLHTESRDCFLQMQQEGVSADAITFICSLKVCGSIKDSETGTKLHTDITSRGFEGETCMGNALIDMYSKCSLLVEAKHILSVLPLRDVVSWNALIAGYAEHRLFEDLLNCFQQMQLDSVSPDYVTFVCCLKASLKKGASETGQQLHIDITKRGLERELYVGNALIDMYGVYKLFADAQKVFTSLSVKDAVSWNSLITGYAQHSQDGEVLSCFQQMQLEGVCPISVTFLCSLKSCGTTKALETGKLIHCEVTKKGLERQLYVGNTLMNMYIKCGSLREARYVFDCGLIVRDGVSWNTLIAGYNEHGPDTEVLDCLKQMQLEGVSVDAVTYLQCLKACGTTGALEIGRAIHAEIRKSAIGGLFVGNTLIDMYGRCGSIAEGQEVFDKMPDRNVVSWNALIRMYGENNEGKMATQCFEDMQGQGVKPDVLTFSCVLAACSHASLVTKGQEYFKMMRKHEVEPMLNQYACMVDLFARSGHVYEAERFIAAMHCPPSSEILMALLTACKIYGEVEVGQKCFQQLVEMNQEDASAYLLLADMYVCAGRQDDADRIQELRIDVRAKEKLATTSMELHGHLHTFFVGGNQSVNMQTVVEVLGVSMKGEGYVPNLEFSSKYISL